MSANNTSASAKSEYFNLTIKGIGYLSNIRQVNHQNGSFLSCVINALSGPTDNPAYVRFDISVAGKEATSLIARCQKAVDEDKKVLLGFNLVSVHGHIYAEQGRACRRTACQSESRLIKVDWIKIGQDMVYKTEKSDSVPPQNGSAAQQNYAKTHSDAHLTHPFAGCFFILYRRK